MFRHRDVKPQNLFVFSAQGQVTPCCARLRPIQNCDISFVQYKTATVCIARDGAAQVKLGDLDLGRYFSTSKAQTNSSVGTPFYMSPECMRSEP